MIHKEILKRGAETLGINLSQDQIDKFCVYTKELEFWSDKMNLTGIKNEKEIIINHYLDSLSIKKHIKPKTKILDIGTGAGFPGVPLAICDETLDIVVADSVGKKIFFVRNVIRTLKLKNIKAIRTRVGSPSDGLERGSFDYVITRAVSDLGKVIILSGDYIKDTGTIILMRGGEGMKEWKKLDKKISDRYSLELAEDIKIPFSPVVRTNLFVTKLN